MAENSAEPAGTGGGNPQQAIADSLGAMVPGADLPPPSSGALDDIPLQPPVPFWVRWKLLPLGALAATAAWLWFSYQFVELNLGWNNLTALLPHELGGLAAGVATPVACCGSSSSRTSVAPISSTRLKRCAGRCGR